LSFSQLILAGITFLFSTSNNRSGGAGVAILEIGGGGTQAARSTQKDFTAEMIFSRGITPE
jgi:hypothetical protein